MNHDDELNLNEKLEIPQRDSKTDVKFLNSLSERSLGFTTKKNLCSSYNLKAYAEDELVKKQFKEMRCEMPGTARSTFLMVFSPDGSKVASTHGNHHIYVTDVRTGKHIKTLIGHPRTPWCIAFHPSSNQIIASGCLGGQVRIWDLSGGSEVWTAESQTVIASIAFHPDDRLLVIATYNELYFWDWSKPEPFMHVATASAKEKVRYVAFDKLGHKLITGITNSPQTRWERVRAPVPVPRPADRAASPYRRRITPRLLTTIPVNQAHNNLQCTSRPNPTREPLSSVPERERRITTCYRDLVHQYEVLVHRYLQIYRPPVMIDQGTDPMDLDQSTSTSNQTPTVPPPEPGPSTSYSPPPSTSASLPSTSHSHSPVPSTSGTQGLKKSSASQPAKNRRILYKLEYPSSSTSSTSSDSFSPGSQPGPSNPTLFLRKSSKTISSTQTTAQQASTTSHDAITASLSSSSPRSTTPQANDNKIDFRIRIQRSADNSSSDEEETLLQDIIDDFENRSRQRPGENAPSTSRCTRTDEPDHSRESPVYRYLNLARRGQTEVMRERLSPNVTRVTMTRRFIVPMSSSNINLHDAQLPRTPNRRSLLIPKTSDSQTQSTSTTSQEPTYKMRIQCSLKPTNEADSNQTQEPSTSNASAATEPTVTQTNDNISDLIRNAELMLAKFREDLEQRGHLQGQDTPAPSTSLPTLPTQGQNKEKPSKGTSTSVPDVSSSNREVLRKRLYPWIAKKLKRGPVINSSDSSSSDDEQKPKRGRASNVAEPEPTVTAAGPSDDKLTVPSSSIGDHSYAGTSTARNDPSNEHSYAGVSDASTNPDNTVRIKINLSSVSAELFRSEPARSFTVAPTPQRPRRAGENPNFYTELELLVTDLLAKRERNQNATAPPAPTPNVPPPTEESSDTDRVCSTCGGNIDDRSRSSENNNSSNSTTPTMSCARTNICARSLMSTTTGTTNSTTYTSAEPLRRRFLSHRLSAFHPTRLSSQRTPLRTFRSAIFPEPLIRSRLGNLMSSDSPTRSPSFAPDEVVNYAERMNEEEAPRAYHPFDPPPELMSINPENIGIGNMYSNIVQELESSLNDVRNIRANRRLGETSDMLSSFSERLESIMTQSNAILRNLSSSLDSLPTNDAEGLFSRSNQEDPLYDLMGSPIDARRNAWATNNPVTSDHTYPLNPENPQMANMSPLMVSLHLTVSHIQRQARLLRQQVESIERIDRAMLEVAQLQMMRQMFDELHRHFSSITGNDSRIGVSSVRQMMAGTRISDSSPYDSPNDDNTAPTPTPEQEPQASTSSAPQETPGHSARSRTRKTYPRCLFLMHRQSRRTNNLTSGSRRCSTTRDRILKRNIFRRFVPSRPNSRTNVDLSSNRGRGYLSLFNPDTLPSMTRRLEHFLMEHGKFIGRCVIPTTTGSNMHSDVGEHIMMLRLRNCRRRMNRIMGLNEDANRNEYASVTIDGSSRFGARQTLSSILDTLTRYMEVNTNSHISSPFRSHIWEVIELSLLLSEILLLQIVDSIPPPSGMNLDPERESLSLRIDQMCSRMLQSRLSGQSQQLTKNLRLLRLTVRHATQALGQTYTARRNAMLPSNNDNERLDSRQGLLDDIHNCLRNIRRHRETSTRMDGTSNPTGREWYRTINDLITRYTNLPSQEGSTSSVLNNETGEETRPPTVEDANSSDDNISSSNSNSMSRERISRPLYRTSNVNLLHNEDSLSSGARNRLWNVPTVTVNDLPVSEPQHSPWHPRFLTNRQRLSDRLDEMRTTGGLFRPRFLHPLYAGLNPFEPDLDDPHREQIYDSDIIANVTPNHRIQVWEFSHGTIPSISNALKNVVVTECKIHNDASVDYASDGSVLVTLLPSGGYMNVTNRLGVYSLEWETLGQCLYQTSFQQNAVSVSLSPLNRYLVVGLASRRVPAMLGDKWTMAQIFLLDEKEAPFGKLNPIRELEQNRDTNYMSVNCIRWLPSSGQGLVFATNTGRLRFLT